MDVTYRPSFKSSLFWRVYLQGVNGFEDKTGNYEILYRCARNFERNIVPDLVGYFRHITHRVKEKTA